MTSHRARQAAVAIGAVLLATVTACSGDSTAPTTSPQPITTAPAVSTPTTTTPSRASIDIEGVPVEARIASGLGEPRSSSYWIVWSSCGKDNRAETAAANGGRDAGWIILDDLLADPGVTLGDHQVGSCSEGIAILDSSQTAPMAGLARQLLAAELNLNSASEYCQAGDETVLLANALLSSSGYAGPDTAPDADPDAVKAAEGLSDLLAAYNTGELCR